GQLLRFSKALQGGRVLMPVPAPGNSLDAHRRESPGVAEQAVDPPFGRRVAVAVAIHSNILPAPLDQDPAAADGARHGLCPGPGVELAEHSAGVELDGVLR